MLSCAPNKELYFSHFLSHFHQQNLAKVSQSSLSIKSFNKHTLSNHYHSQRFVNSFPPIPLPFLTTPPPTHTPFLFPHCNHTVSSLTI